MTLTNRARAFARLLVNQYRSRYQDKILEFATSKAGPWVPLYGDRGDPSVDSITEIEMDVDRMQRRFFVPVQYSDGNTGTLVFPPLDTAGEPAIPTSALIRFSGKIYSIKAWAQEGDGAQFALDCLLSKTTYAGVNK